MWISDFVLGKDTLEISKVAFANTKSKIRIPKSEIEPSKDSYKGAPHVS